MQIKRFNWMRKPSAYEFAQSWKSQRAGMIAQFQADAQAASSAFAGAQNNMLTGLNNLAAQAAVDRTKSTLNSQIATMQSNLAGLSTTPDSSSSGGVDVTA